MSSVTAATCTTEAANGGGTTTTSATTTTTTKMEEDPEEHLLRVMSEGLLRVAVVGNVDAGKSTLIGTLCHSKLDDGNGSNRLLVSKFKHEIESGRTSTITTHLLAFDAQGVPVVPPKNAGRAVESYVAAHAADRAVSLIDLAGHEKYFRTTIAGLSRGMADYALVLVNASQGLTYMTLHHLSLCHMCGIPVIIVITKIDAAPQAVLQHSRAKITEAVRSPEIGKRPFRINQESDLPTVVDQTHALVPVFEISCVTGQGLDLLRLFLGLLPRRRLHEKKLDRPFEFLMEEVFNVTGVGTVLSGFVNAGSCHKGDTLWIGPLKDASYMKTTVKSIHIAQTLVEHVSPGHSACLAVALTKQQRRLLSRKGMVLQKEPLIPPVSGFTAEIVLAKGNAVTMVKGQTQTTLHILHLKQTCKLQDFEIVGAPVGQAAPTVLRPGQRARATFTFLQGPQYVRPGMRVILREGHVRGIGMIKEVHNMVETAVDTAAAEALRNKRRGAGGTTATTIQNGTTS